jgi:hypothetical protein
MAVTQEKLKQHFLNLGSAGAIYVWGANGQTITEDTIEYLYTNYRSSKYGRKYYDDKLAEGKGKIGADCSGSLYPVSGYDTTASKYYSKCVEKGGIKSLPRNKVCLVFKKDAKNNIVHVGCYTGDGYVSEMASSKLNYQRKKVDGNGWSLWGMPDFVSDPKTTSASTNKQTMKASDVKMTQIKRKSKGKAVKVWQAIIGVDVDGSFGPATEEATIAFQKKAFPNEKNEWDGVVGNKTWKAGLESV